MVNSLVFKSGNELTYISFIIMLYTCYRYYNNVLSIKYDDSYFLFGRNVLFCHMQGYNQRSLLKL